MAGLLTLGGCSYLETMTSRAAAPDDRVQLGWQDGPLFLRRWEIPDYTCIDDLMLQCARAGPTYLCQCVAE